MKSKGFTLVELLAVIVILAIIAIITVVSVNSIISDSENSLSETQLKNIENAAEAYYLKEGMNSNSRCINVSELIEKGYLEGDSVKDPKTREDITGSVKITYKSNQYSYEYQDEVCVACTIERQVAGIYTVGDIVSCEFTNSTEQFYVIENQDTDTTEGIDMLAMYNLTLSTINPIQDTTGAENVVVFSSTNYWYDSTNNTYTEEFANYASEGRSYPYVYDSRSNLYLYVEAYREVLEGMGVNAIEAKLLSYEQIIKLGCSSANSRYCSSAPTWVSSSSYWLGSIYDSNYVWNVRSWGGYTYDYYDGSEDTVGVRPVITIPVSDLV